MSDEFDDLAVHAVSVLRDRGERITAPRRAVIEELARTTAHLTAEDLFARVTKREPGTHLATVYRTLDALIESGLAVHVHLAHGATTYHLARPGHRTHLHLLCRDCDALVDAPADMLDAVAEQLERTHGFRLDPNHVALTGWCSGCRPNE